VRDARSSRALTLPLRNHTYDHVISNYLLTYYYKGKLKINKVYSRKYYKKGNIGNRVTKKHRIREGLEAISKTY